LLQVLKLLIVVSAFLAGYVMLNYAIDFKRVNSEPNSMIFRQSCLFFGFFLLIVSLAFLYTKASGSLKRADLKLLDWALIVFVLCLMSILELVDPSLLLWVLFVVFPSVVVRLIICYYKRAIGR